MKSSKRGQPGVVQATGRRGIPSKPALGLLDRQIVDARMPVMHQPVGIKLPVLIAIRAKPVAGVVMPLVGESHSDPGSPKSPKLLDQPVIQLPLPFSGQEFDDGRPLPDKFGAVSPPTINRIGQSDPFRVTTVP